MPRAQGKETFKLDNAAFESGDRGRLFLLRNQRAVVAPPVESNLLSFIDRAHQQPDANGQQLDVGEGNPDVTGDDQTFIENTVKDVD